ncbi:protein MOTHER of FT and TFL1 [Coffea eugenioides]|uniref:protein MOTHER of FT and TFL1 n=1 Tax=Coffea eugenioides TaxID=49369 RepID=UPI000F614ED5|nr:protein MOTHER of FT and TFL1 [Coffea eugenioides]
MAVNSDPLVVFQFIGDVVEMFEPSVSMSLYFDDKNVTNGSDVKPSLAASAPLVTIGGEPGKFYTLVMIDPDDPSPSEPTLREWAHWIVTDIPGGSIASQGETLQYLVLVRSTTYT